MQLVIIFVWFFGSMAVGFYADRIGRSSVGWALVSLLLSPLLGFLLVAALGKAAARDRAACPFCAEMIKLTAKICPHCRSDLSEYTVVDKKR
jgi:hypothetical protein